MGRETDSGNDEIILHLCLGYRGRGPGCGECKILARGFCDTAVAVLDHGSRKLSSEYRSVSDLDKEEILANTFIGMHRNISTFEGNSRAQFFVWGHQIFKRRIIDYFRRRAREYIFRITEEALTQMMGGIPNDIITKLESLAGLLYNTEGEFRKAIDAVLGESDTERFWRIISRCSRRIRTLLPPPPPPRERDLERIGMKLKERFPELSGDVDFLMDIIRNQDEGRSQQDLAPKYRISVAALKKRKQRVLLKFKELAERLRGQGLETDEGIWKETKALKLLIDTCHLGPKRSDL